MKLNKKRILVTGASHGIGRAVALSLARKGCNLALVARNHDELQKTAELCRNHTEKVIAIAFDLCRLNEIKGLIDKICTSLSGLDVLINNAGIGYHGRVGEVDISRWEKLIDLNLKSLIILSHFAVKQIEKNSEGAIINIASIAGKSSYGGSAAYCASKHGVVGFSGSLFEDVREKNIKVCAICPGYVNTPMVQGRSGLDYSKMIDPHDIAFAVNFVLESSATGCPTEITIRPQKTPYL